jgi:hypothetical protein
MISVTKYWNPKQKALSELLKSEATFDQAISACIDLHNQVHDVRNENEKTIYQELLQVLNNDAVVYRPSNGFASIAWNLWHITRIEDAVSNIIINDSAQVITGEILGKLNVSVTDTGNAFSASDVDSFSRKINFAELLKYRKKVGKKTVSILKGLSAEARKRKPTQEQLQRLIREKVVTESEESMWLIDFWGKKTVSGLLTMPITRHQIVHINDCFKLIDKFNKARSR